MECFGEERFGVEKRYLCPTESWLELYKYSRCSSWARSMQNYRERGITLDTESPRDR